MSISAVINLLAAPFWSFGLYRGLKINVVGAIVLLGFGVMGVIFLFDVVSKRLGKKK